MTSDADKERERERWEKLHPGVRGMNPGEMRWAELLMEYDLEHRVVMFLGGVWQCLDCGCWTRVSRETLDKVLCLEPLEEDVDSQEVLATEETT